MSFYDDVDLSSFKLLSLIKGDPSCADPCPEFVDAIKNKKRSADKITVAEVGIGFGATTLFASMLLSADDEYYCFDLNERTEPLADDLSRIPYIECKIALFGNSARYWDSYVWSLSNLALKMHENNQQGMFDVVYLDGSHAFFQDGLALCLLKELLKKDGILFLDDVHIKMTDFVPDKEFLNTLMTPEQFEDQQVLRAMKIFLLHDPNFQMLSDIKSDRAVFKKLR